MYHRIFASTLLALVSLHAAAIHAQDERLKLAPTRATASRNIIFVLCDDHRWDALGFRGHPFLETPHLDRMRAGGTYFPNAYVTTSLCSPSRASILTGLYTHNHRVTDNYHPVDQNLIFFPQYLQQAGYETAFIGKWHMGGEDDAPQRGFDHWVAFKGQGTYWPDGHGTTRVVPQETRDGINVNGKRVDQKGYITDELTDYAIDWITNRNSDKPYFLYVSHKAVHSDFVPHDRHLGRYRDAAWTPPITFADNAANRQGKPMWTINQRNSRHGVDYGYNLEDFDLGAYYRRYCECLLAVDDNMGRIFQMLEKSGELEKTLVVYMGDNGFSFGEHGLIDKRTAYESSIRVPLMMHCPELIRKNSTVDAVVANIDIAPTLLEVARLQTPESMDGKSFFPFIDQQQTADKLTAAQANWRSGLLYEYFWEWNYPQTPTMHALIGDRYKYIRYHGLWDTDELYDLKSDPHEQHNLIREETQQHRAQSMREQLFTILAESHGEDLPLLPDRGRQFYNRHPDRAKQAEFPPEFYLPMVPVTE
jgi:N-acetylglucosamine-6-sulfatase